MKHRTHKLAAKAVATILCAALMLTACGSKETASNETASTKTTSVESTVESTTEATVTEPTVEPTVEPTEAPTEAPTETAPAPSVEPTAEPVVTETTTAADAGYTYSELNQTMYAKSAVNVRDLPSTDGKKIGSLKASQEITVTGKCDQTGWYRFELNGTTAYVSDKYIVSEKPAVNTVASTGNSNTAGNQYASNTVDDTFGITEEQIENFMKTHGDGATGNTGNAATEDTFTTNDYFDRATAEQVFASVNAERTAAGIPALTWSEDLYNIAVQRCYEDDGHTGMRAGTSENYTTGGGSDAARIHQKWHDSEGHYNNYMNSKWAYGAVAVRICYSTIGGIQLESYHIAYEVFSAGDNNTATNSSVTINTPVTEDPVAAAPKTADEDTSASSSNVGWSMTPPTQEDGLKKWQEQNPDVEVSFGN